MRSRTIVALVVVLGALSAPSAAVAAISVTRAELNGTALRVEGSGAVPNSTITVSSPQQSVTGRADATGAFRIQQDPFTSSTCSVTVSDGSTSATATLSGCTPSQPPPPPGAPALSGLTLNPASVAGGTTSTGTVSLSAAAPAATTVALSSSNVNVAAVPASVTIAAGATSASFTVTTATAVPASTTVTITASSSGVTKSAALTVTGSPLAISTAGLICTNGVCELGPGNVGTFFYVAISSSGGTGPTPFNWTLVAGRLPDGLTLNDPRQCGVHCVSITGTPTTVQATTFTIQVQDGAGATAQQAFSIAINPPRPLVVTTPGNCCPPGTIGAAYSIHFFADGGVQPYSWSLAAGQFPPGLRLDPSGLLSGTPSTTGTFTFTMRVTDNTGAQATGGPFSITIS
jgi:large repetitive protein